MRTSPTLTRAGGLLLAGLAACASDHGLTASGSTDATTPGDASDVADPAANLLDAPVALAAPADPPAPAGPRTIVLGLDGMDHGLTAELLARGELPNMARLTTFGPLQTLVPVQSPATWAAFNTGRNPGQTGVPGFVARYFARGDDGSVLSQPLPMPMLGYAVEVPCHDVPGLTHAPYEANPNQAIPWWRHLDAAGVRTVGLQVPMTSPPDDEGPHTRLLAGLGVKDISGSPGSWFVFSDDPWSWEKGTNTAGKIFKVFFDQDDATRARTELPGPNDWVALGRAQARVDQAQARLDGAAPGSLEAEQAAAARDAAAGDLRRLRRERPRASVPFDIVALDRSAGRVTLRFPDFEVTLAVGEWSGLLPVTFRLDDEVEVHGQVQLHLIRCDEEDVRLFVPPVEWDPARPPARPPISAPPHFAAELVEGTGGRFHTLGWAAPTNPLKDRADSQFEAQAFLTAVTRLHDERAGLLDWALERPAEWDLLYQVFTAPDRVGHLLMREADPDHPLHDAAYAGQTVAAFGASVPLSRAVEQAHIAADRIVGRVLDAVESGALGDDALLLVVSDHGMQSFRRGVNLNNLLWEHGWLRTRGDQAPGEIGGDFLSFVDWEHTRAYSLGLGKIYLNKAGREQQGVVQADEVDEVLAGIRRDLLAARDGPDGPALVTSVVRREQAFDGPWVVEGRDLTRRWAGEDHDVPHWDGYADLFVGFAPGYRIDWACTMGGLSAEAVSDNGNHWSGGHVSVDPRHVPGVLGSNRILSGVDGPGLLDIGPTVLARHGLDPAAHDLEGRVLQVSSEH